jgi:molybdenum cofactor biosynthesis protein B
MQQPHPDRVSLSLNCGVITVSDTRTTATDTSGALIQELLTATGHQIGSYTILPDEPLKIQVQLTASLQQNPPLQVLIINGGTGIAPRDTTYDAIAVMLTKTLPGFGEIFRYLSYQDIGSRAIASRALSGIYEGLLVFSIPGSRGAVQLAMEKLILPEMVHLVTQIHPDIRPLA